MTDRESRGAQAAALLETPAFVDAIAAVDQAITQQFRGALRAEQAWDARQRLRALNDVLGYLHAAVADGEAARAEGAPGPNAIDRILSGNVETMEDRVRRYREAAQASYERLAASETPEMTPEEGSDARADHHEPG